jgi:SAM-dependent methyltransferase
MPAAYDEDLAYIPDVGFGGFARDAAPGLLEMLRQRGVTNGRVVDLGCGSGIWAERLMRAGYDVVGFDLSAAMIAMARKRAPGAELYRKSFLDVELPPCDAVTSLGECFNYLFDAKAGEKSLSRLFRNVHAALRPGGLFIFDVATPGRGAGPTVKNFSGRDWAILIEVDEDKPHRVLTRRITSFRKIGKLYRRNEEIHRLRLYRPLDIAAMLRKAGFRARIVRGYGKLRFKPGHHGFVARKP